MTVTQDGLETQLSDGSAWPQPSVLDSGDIHDREGGRAPLDRVAALPEQLDAAWLAASAAELPPAFARPERFVILGVGASATGGDLLQALASDLGARTPVLVVRGYTLPSIVDRRSLVLACSAGGPAEEAASALREAIAAHIPCGVIAAGGPLVDIAREHRIPVFAYDSEGTPRAAIGWSFGTLLALAARCGVLSRTARDLPRALDAVRIARATMMPDVSEALNPAKQLARRLAGRLPIVVGAQAMAPVAYHWRTQLIEHARTWTLCDELLEMSHTPFAGVPIRDDRALNIHAVFLRHASMHERIRLSVSESAGALSAQGMAAEIVDIAGPSVLAQVLCGVQFGEFLSYYAALLNGTPRPPHGLAQPAAPVSPADPPAMGSFREVRRADRDDPVTPLVEIPPYGTRRAKGIRSCGRT
jgi:glucose/mannose-6-phosphate isomerase